MKLEMIDRLLASAVAAACLISWAGVSHAQSSAYPTKPIRFVIANSPGGGLDITARVTGPVLTSGLGQQMIYDNRGGAARSIAAETVAKAAPDGYTMLCGSIGNLSVNPHLYKGLGYDPLTDLAPVTFAVSGSNVLVVHPTVAAKSVQELIALARKQPGALTYGSSGTYIKSEYKQWGRLIADAGIPPN